jgi:hypothetical protein
MSEFAERLKTYLKEEEKSGSNFKDATPSDFKAINKDPESRTIKKDEAKEVDTKTLDAFLTLVNPTKGQMKKNCIFKYVNEFRKRNRDILIITSKDEKAESIDFYAVDRENFASFIATIMEDEEALKALKAQIKSVYTVEQTELALEDYIDMVIKGKISIITNPGEEFDVEAPTSPMIYKVAKEQKETNKKKLQEDSKQVEFYAKQLLPIIGGVITGVAVDENDEFFGLRIAKNSQIKVLWILQDDEGNGPGSFSIE